MTRKGFIIVAITIAFFMLSVVPCFSQAILGCYHNKNGKLRVVSDFSQCKKTELPITFNTGEQGPPGPQGIQGPQGEQGPPGVVQGPIVLMETGGGVVTQSSNFDGNTYVTLFEYPCSANSPNYMHVSLTTTGYAAISGGVKVVVSYNDNDPTSYDNNIAGILLYGGTGHDVPKTIEFAAAKRQLPDTTCAFWKIVSVSTDQPVTVRYNYTVTYPQM